MTNYDLINVLLNLFREYFVFMLPVFGVMAGLNIIFRLIYLAMFRPFDRMQ